MKFSLIFLAAFLAFAFASERFEYIPTIKNNHFHKALTKEFLTGPSNEDPLEIALAFVRQVLPTQEFVVTDHYTSKHNGVTHVYGRQLFNGRPIMNANFNINVDSQGRVVNMAESFFKGEAKLPSIPSIDPLTAILRLAKKLNVPLVKKIQLVKYFAEKFEGIFTGGDFSLDEIPVKLAFVQSKEGEALELVWHINVRRDENWYDAFVNTESGELALLVDWFKGASYNVYALPVNDPLDGDRSVVVDPHKASTGSPLGWHDQGDDSFTTTIGNNVYAQENFNGLPGWENNYRPEGGSSLSFDFPVDFSEEPREYVEAAITNLFYWNNIVHDVFYEYGFDEVSGNFQENNFGNGGLGNDAVQANAQDGSGYNNANFATPPDGQRPRMRMYLWNQVSPMLDGDFDNGIIIHEYAHGISNRLVGGPSNSNCMSGGQAGGMGEGHGDCFSLFLRWKPEYNHESEFGMGEYAAGRGIRLYPYAYDNKTNPQTYSYINGGSYSGVHAKGGVWCTIVYDTYLDLIQKYGFDADWYRGKGGNNALLQILVDSFKLGPCSPTFVETRDAMLLADQVKYAGTYSCDIWKAFARRGLGVNAVDTNNRVVDDFTVPPQCS